VDCITCGVIFGLPERIREARRNDHKTFYCPNGHTLSYRGETDAEKAEKRAKELERQLNITRDRLKLTERNVESSEHSRAAMVGNLTKIRKAIAAGRCPVNGCKKFPNGNQRMEEHLKVDHPKWVAPEEAP
jgi:hypothetical protein